MRACVRARARARVCECVSVCVYVCAFVRACVRACACVCVRLYDLICVHAFVCLLMPRAMHLDGSRPTMAIM